MNRIYNNPDYMVEDMTKGFLKANKDLIAETENPPVSYTHLTLPTILLV